MVRPASSTLLSLAYVSRVPAYKYRRYPGTDGATASAKSSPDAQNSLLLVALPGRAPFAL
jgi:hypothetical protein